MGRGPGPSKMEQIHNRTWPNFSPDCAIMTIKNLKSLHFYYSILSLSSSKILLHDKNENTG